MNDRLLLRFNGHSPRLRASACVYRWFMVNFKIDLEAIQKQQPPVVGPAVGVEGVIELTGARP